MLKTTLDLNNLKDFNDIQGSVDFIEVIKNRYLFFDSESFFLTLINTYQDPYEKSLERQRPTLRREESKSKAHSGHYLFMFWTFIKYLQEIFVQFWVQHGNFWLHIFVQHQGEDGKHGVDGGVSETHPMSRKMTSDTRCFTLFIVRLSSEMHNYRSYNFHIFPFLDFNSALTQRKCQRREAAKCTWQAVANPSLYLTR